jgi:phosphatidylinositol alpha-mannosyltransferase
VVRRYDWSAVTGQVLAVYEMVIAGAGARVAEDPTSRRLVSER